MLPFYYFVFVVFASVFACKKDAVQPSVPVNNPEGGGKYSYLALGDSYTIGQGVPESERFPAQTQAMLHAEGWQINNLVYIATTGWTTTNLANAIEHQPPKGPFDIVSLLIGVNDQHQYGDTIGYSERFTKLLLKAIELAADNKNHVFVLSIPDYSVTPYGAINDTVRIRKQIDQFNSINLRIANSLGISYTDVTTISREARNDVSLLASDGLHPSGKMYRRWAELLKNKIKAGLKK